MSDNIVVVETVNSPQIVEVNSTASIEVIVPTAPSLVELTSPGPQGPAGPQGPSGASGGASQKFDITVSSGTWIVSHGLGRLPYAVQVFLTSGEFIQPDISISTTQITVVLASPNTGFILAI